MAVSRVSSIDTGSTLDLGAYIRGLGRSARETSRVIARADTATRNRALTEIAAGLEAAVDSLLAANRDDVEHAEASGLDAALLDRLVLDEARVAAMAAGVRDVAALADPVGEISGLAYRPSGIQVGRMRVPLGVIAIIYESRPNVTADAASLCLKAGNACILRGGSEAMQSNRAIAGCVTHGLQQAGLPGAAVQLVDTTDRAAVGELIRLREYIDVIVPRGGRSLIERVASEATVPVIKHLDGVCHVYIDDAADLARAADIAFNAKTHRYGVCNAMETLLVARSVAARLLPPLAARLHVHGVELRGCAQTLALVPQAVPAVEADWGAEYLAPILAVRVVDGLDAAIAHIETYGSHHTDAIVTEDLGRARRFLAEVDSSSVMVNASTRFADGYEYGLGAEIGISTDKLHARGPVGLEGLTTQKYIVIGNGHVRQ